MAVTKKLAALAAAFALSAPAAFAEPRPSMNLYGVTGLIDMPSGETQPDGTLSFTTSYFGNINRNTLTFQITPRISGSFRYIGIQEWNAVVPDPFITYYDRSFDVQYKVLNEGRYLPALTIGLQDIAGTGLNAAEYIVASKSLGPRVTVTGGLGFGRFGTYGAIGSPFGERDRLDFGRGGTFNFGQWFRGPAAPFGGVAWQASDRLTVKVEYSSDIYAEEAASREVFDRRSPFNFGLEYQASKRVRLGVYSLYGSEIGLSLNLMANPREPISPLRFESPLAVQVRPSRATAPQDWSTDWLAQSDAQAILTQNVTNQLALDNIKLHSLVLNATTAELRIIDERWDARANAIGRAARALAYMLPASVEEFRIIPVVNSQQTVAVVVKRSDLERLEVAPEPAAQLWAVTKVEDAAQFPMPAAEPGIFPRFSWSVAPYFRTSYFDPRAPIRLETGLQARLSYKTERGFELTGSVRAPLASGLDNPRPPSNSVLPHVRSDTALYDRNAKPVALEFLTASQGFRPGPNLYGRVIVGYLEPMFAGVAGEILWKPARSRLAFGAELAYARQRETDMRFGFQDYSIVTGHVSAYAQLGRGFEAQLDVGRYLAGDIGATLSIDRDFANGWRVGVFATKTNVSSEEFGEGSFDKGFRVSLPLTFFTGQPSQTVYSTIIRPIQRDGGARLDVRGRLYDTLRNDDSGSYAQQWSRFWR